MVHCCRRSPLWQQRCPGLWCAWAQGGWYHTRCRSSPQVCQEKSFRSGCRRLPRAMGRFRDLPQTPQHRYPCLLLESRVLQRKSRRSPLGRHNHQKNHTFGLIKILSDQKQKTFRSKTKDFRIKQIILQIDRRKNIYFHTFSGRIRKNKKLQMDRRLASQPASQASKQARKPASRPARQANQQGSQPASPASKQASKQASKEARKPASQPGKQARKEASQPASQPGKQVAYNVWCVHS